MISVALCTYNGEKYLKKQLDSILSQTMPVDEIVVNDDCSFDFTNSILEDYSRRFPQIKYKRNPNNVGFVKNFENAIERCQGDYIFFSDQDDIWENDKVEVSVLYLKTTGMYGAFSDGKLVDQFDNVLGDTLFSAIQIDLLIKHGILDKYNFEILCLNGNYVTGATIVITKKAKDYILPFGRYLYHDVWVAVKLSAIEKFGRIDKTLISYRIHDNQECGLKNVSKDKLDLLDCFAGKGCCSYLIQERRNSASYVYMCKLKKKERRKLFVTYKELYWKNIEGRFPFKEVLLFLITEMIVFFKTRKGLGWVYYTISKFYHNII